MPNRDLEQYCDEQVQRLVREVGIPRPFILSTFLDQFAEWRGRRIELWPFDHIPRGMCGLWLGFPDHDVIAYSRATPLHSEHIILHEVGHMLCNHKGTASVGDDLVRLLPNLNPALISKVLGRTSYSDIEEQEAELIATLIAKKAAGGRPRSRSASTPGLTPELDRLRSTFEE